MKRLAAFAVFTLCGLSAFGQQVNTRWDSQVTTTQGQGQLLPVLSIPGATVSIYVAATTNPATTYPSATSTTPCPSGAQVVWQQPVSIGCTGTTDAQGNFGGWFQPGLYNYYVTVNGQTVGPYFFSVPVSGGGYLPLGGGSFSGPLYTPSVDGEIYPASCGYANTPSWCTGTTADAWIRAACTQLPATGGTINLLGLTGNLAAPVTCSTPTKQVVMIEDPTSLLTVTETDGLITFPLDNGSMLIGPGGGQCPLNNGIHLGSTASVTAIVGPAHTDGTQEFFTASGLCIWGGTGTAHGGLVSKGLIYAKGVFTNTTLSNNVVSVCPNACFWIENDGGIVNAYNNWGNVTSGVYSVTGSALVIASSTTAGCQAQSINVHGGNYEHANGGAAYPEINIYGNGTGAQACGVYLHDLYLERNSSGTPSTVALKIQDCFGCTFSNIEGGGGTGGDMINLSASSQTRVQSVTFSNISNVYGSWTNTLNDTTTGTVLAFATYPYVTSYFSSPGYVQPPVLPGSTVQSLGTDLMNGDGAFASGSATFGNNFHQTGCNVAVVCTYTRTNVAPPPGYTYSAQTQITTNGDLSSGYNGVEYVPLTSFTAGTTYVASFWGKGDGTFTGFPDFLLWISTTPVFYCNSTVATPFTTTWTLYSFTCTATQTGTAHLAPVARTPPGATGTFWVGGFTFSPVVPITPLGGILTAVGPYGMGPATSGNFGTVNIGTGAGAPTSTCGTAPVGNGSEWHRTDGTASTTLYVCAANAWTAVTVP